MIAWARAIAVAIGLACPGPLDLSMTFPLDVPETPDCVYEQPMPELAPDAWRMLCPLQPPAQGLWGARREHWSNPPLPTSCGGERLSFAEWTQPP